MKNLTYIIGIILLLCFAAETGYSKVDGQNQFAPQVAKPILNFIKSKEGYRSVAYKDAVGVWTIGYGHTKTAKPGMRITRKQGEQLLRKDAERFEKYVYSKTTIPLKWFKYGALVSFSYNLGYRLKGDLLLGMRTGNDALVTYKMKLYIYAGGRILNGLVTRRKEEAQFYKGLKTIIKRYSEC